jgi:hypothetical protein
VRQGAATGAGRLPLGRAAMGLYWAAIADRGCSPGSPGWRSALTALHQRRGWAVTADSLINYQAPTLTSQLFRNKYTTGDWTVSSVFCIACKKRKLECLEEDNVQPRPIVDQADILHFILPRLTTRLPRTRLCTLQISNLPYFLLRLRPSTAHLRTAFVAAEAR